MVVGLLVSAGVGEVAYFDCACLVQHDDDVDAGYTLDAEKGVWVCVDGCVYMCARAYKRACTRARCDGVASTTINAPIPHLPMRPWHFSDTTKTFEPYEGGGGRGE